MKRFSSVYLDDLKKTLDHFPHDNFEKFIEILLNAYKSDKHIFVMGNGGSASTASHFTCDLNKGCCLNKQTKFKVFCLNDNVATLMAYANDLSYEHVFVEQLKNFFVQGDIVVGISGSGNSTNVLKAIQYANEQGGFTVGLCGYQGGELYKMVHLPILAAVHDMQKVEDLHMIIVHMTMQRICQALSNDKECDGMAVWQ
jgi:D-sedoheptulose 7-phosphate isomerase